VEEGSYSIVYAVTDNCGNTAYQPLVVEVEDCKKPYVLCDDDLIVEIMQTGMVEVHASLFDEGSEDNCGGSLSFSYSADVTDTTLVFTCGDLGEIELEVWATDEENNQDFCEVVLILQDNMGVCTTLVSPTIAGLVTNEDQEALEGATIEINEGNWSQTTDINGFYSIELPSEGDYTIAPILDAHTSNGVTTYDLVLIQRHILGISLLDSPYKLIAADANNSGSISTLDLVSIRKVILQMEDHFPNNTSWRFVDAEYIFPIPELPWNEAFPEVLNFNNFSADDLFADFIAIKIGDVNGTAVMHSLDGLEDRTLYGELTFHVQDRTLEPGQTYEIPFYGDGQEVFGYQYTLELGSQLEVNGIREGIAEEKNFGFALLEEGALTTSWHAGLPRMLNRDDAVFTLLVQAKEKVVLSEAMAISSRFTEAEAYNIQGNLLDVQLDFDEPSEGRGHFELYQNNPNPFRKVTTIRFHLPETCMARLIITDVSGKVLEEIRGEFPQGYNEVELRGIDIPGVLYYHLETDIYSATRKMVHLR